MAKVARLTPKPDRNAARVELEHLWTAVLATDVGDVSQQVRSLVNSGQTSIRFCLPTQLLGKRIDPALDALCLQKGDGESGRWDPLSFSVAVIVPWNTRNQNVLGRSGDPYVSNPLRRPRVDHGLDQMADRDQWESLTALLKETEAKNDHAHTRKLLVEVLTAIRDRLRELTFNYVLPPRISLNQARTLVLNFLAERSGGDRGLAVTAALFETFGARFGIYEMVRRSVINASDAATNSAGDLECVDKTGHVIVAVEVKERTIGLMDVQTALAKAREFGVREMALCTEGVQVADCQAVDVLIRDAWASGTNLYHLSIGDLIQGSAPLLGEVGIRAFIERIGQQLDRFSSQPRHRKAWKSLLDDL